MGVADSHNPRAQPARPISRSRTSTVGSAVSASAIREPCTRSAARVATREAGRGGRVGIAWGCIGGLLTGLGLAVTDGAGAMLAAGRAVATVANAAPSSPVRLEPRQLDNRGEHPRARWAGIRRRYAVGRHAGAPRGRRRPKAILDGKQAVDQAGRGEAYQAEDSSSFDGAAKRSAGNEVNRHMTLGCARVCRMRWPSFVAFEASPLSPFLSCDPRARRRPRPSHRRAAYAGRPGCPRRPRRCGRQARGR